MVKIISDILSFIGVVAFLGGFPCLIWAGFFGGPEWAMYWGLFGLPVLFTCVASADVTTPGKE